MSNKETLTRRLKAALKAQAEFSARGSDCPLCGREFRSDNCPHSIAEAHAALAANVVKATIQ